MSISIFCSDQRTHVEAYCAADSVLAASNAIHALGRMDIYTVIEDDLHIRRSDCYRLPDSGASQARRPKAKTFRSISRYQLVYELSSSNFFDPAILGGSAMAVSENAHTPFIRSLRTRRKDLLCMDSDFRSSDLFHEVAIGLCSCGGSNIFHLNELTRRLKACV